MTCLCETVEKKPAFPEGYFGWLNTNHDVVVTTAIRNNYRAVAREALDAFQTSPFWENINNSLKDINDKYLIITGYNLIVTEQLDPKFKSFDSFLLKTYRRNVRDNLNWPNEPSGGWVLPNNWLTCIKDIIRTTIIVKYLDGVTFMIGELERLAEDNSIDLEYNLEATAEGYYAAHLYYKKEVQIPDLTFNMYPQDIFCEIQITTQIKEVIKTLLHRYYERERVDLKLKSRDWQWNYQSEEFSASYLGHILHYVEGMIVQIRDRGGQKK